MHVTDASPTPGTQEPSPPATRRFGRLAAFWATPSGKIMVLATVLALGVRIFMLVRSGYLRGITEYDDGVYLGATIRLTQGVMPYKDFAFVQPPGILLLMAPVGVVAQLFTTVKALALARLLTTLASAACVPLAGNLVRYRGSVVTLVTCGILAVYPADIATAHTLLLEPWMNACCLLAANAAFRRGALASPRRLAWSGLALGFATAIKFWAAAPAAVVLALCLLTPPSKRPLTPPSKRPLAPPSKRPLAPPSKRPLAPPSKRPLTPPSNPTFTKYHQVSRYVAGLAVGFLVPVLPFLLSAPSAFWNGTVADQATRAGSAVPLAIRTAYLTGTIDFMNSDGQISFAAGSHSMYAASFSPQADLSAGVGWLPYAAAALVIALTAIGFARQRRRLTHLEWAALATSVLAMAAVCGYSAFFYHYADFPIPWLAIIVGSGAGALAALPDRPRFRLPLLRSLAALFVLVSALQVWEAGSSREPEAENMAHHIPVGSCVVTDEVSLPIAADRFTASPPGCPVIIDSLASTLVLSNGISPQGDASKIPAVVAQWRAWLGAADYVWLSPHHYSRRRIPWTPALSAWFNATFRPDGSYSPGTGQLYKRITPPPRRPGKTAAPSR
ncbi:MAG: hypothetical protein J2P25_22715 [Nocardiopsaceae bacterium]|nr:hypothetical protein [Nocardiopsaceae bacterium]